MAVEEDVAGEGEDCLEDLADADPFRLRHDGDLPPLLLVHPAGGQVVHYRGLLAHAPAQQPLFAFEAAGLRGDTAPDTSLPRMASRYLQAMQTIKSKEAYTLGGWSVGGLVSFEMAKQLVDAGEEVERLVVIDTPAPYATEPPAPDEVLGWFLEDLQLGDATRCLDLSAYPPKDGQQRARLKASLGQLDAERPSLTVDDLLPMFAVFEASINSAATFVAVTVAVTLVAVG